MGAMITARQAAIRAAIATAAPQACQGHYLDRMIAIAQAFSLPLVALLRANRDFLRDNHKPEGLDDLLNAVSELVIAIVQHSGLEPEALRPIAWGLDWRALESEGLVWLRLDGNDSARSDQGA